MPTQIHLETRSFNNVIFQKQYFTS